ncbi:hypothetical protein CYG49_01595, partial [Candidatus Saccharibacteria bacterium]
MSVLMCAVIIGLSIADLLVLQTGNSAIGLPFIPHSIVAAASITGAIGIAAVVLHKKENLLLPLAAVTFYSLVLTVGGLIVLTGFSTSPFIALWMVVTIFAGMFGKNGIGVVAVFAHGYLAISIAAGDKVLPKELVVFALAVEL